MPTIEDLLNTPLECPPPEPHPPQRGYDIAIAVPATPWMSGDRIDIRARPGVLNLPGGGFCGLLEAQVSRDGVSSETVALAQPPACVAVPEPPQTTMMIVGLVAVAFMVTLRRGLR